ncbi:DHKTD1 [Mytilus edulis]|uniref:DHKTD1 n=1 Tax=Mytilus edulis TaxID=6550 RepID=A0A8S3VEU4_MYTED|nr:DHKTD1 [Mytilus edulis]
MSMLTLWRLHSAPRIFQSAYAYTSLYHSENGIYGHRRKEQRLSPEKVPQNVVTSENFQAYRLTEAYRKHGHKKATLDPLDFNRDGFGVPEIDLSNYGLSKDSTTQFDVNGILNNGASKLTTAQLTDTLENIYCGPIAVEFDYLQTEEREWFAHTFESQRKSLIPDERKADLAKLMLKCQAFDHFLANKFTTVKRYGGEGGESMMAIFDEIFSYSSQGKFTTVKRYGGEGGESMMAIFDEIFSYSAQGKFTTVKRYGGEGGESMMAIFDEIFSYSAQGKFTTVKRYGGEGGESMMAIFDEIFSHSAQGKFTTVKRYGKEKGESMMAIFDEIFSYSSKKVSLLQ